MQAPLAIVAKFRYTPEHFVETMERFRGQHSFRHVILTCQIIGVLVFVSGGIMGFYQGVWAAGAFLLLLATMLCLWQQINRWSWRRICRKSPYSNIEYILIFSNEGFDAKSQIDQAFLTWQVFTKVVHFQDGFLLLQGPNLVNWIKRDYLENQAEVTALEAILRAHVKEHKVVEVCRPAPD